VGNPKSTCKTTDDREPKTEYCSFGFLLCVFAKKGGRRGGLGTIWDQEDLSRGNHPDHCQVVKNAPLRAMGDTTAHCHEAGVFGKMPATWGVKKSLRSYNYRGAQLGEKKDAGPHREGVVEGKKWNRQRRPFRSAQTKKKEARKKPGNPKKTFENMADDQWLAGKVI